VYSHPEERIFSMRGMKFPLDFVWIRNGVVVSVDEGIQPPKEGEAPRLISSEPLSADMILEFPAGFAREHDIFIGTMIEYPVN
jgi:uncharacterized membrane protein (UPF0127 family)